MISDLALLSPEENTRLLSMIFEKYQQPFSIVSVRKKLDQKEVVIQLTSGIRKTYQIHNNGVIRLKLI